MALQQALNAVDFPLVNVNLRCQFINSRCHFVFTSLNFVPMSPMSFVFHFSLNENFTCLSILHIPYCNNELHFMRSSTSCIFFRFMHSEICILHMFQLNIKLIASQLHDTFLLQSKLCSITKYLMNGFGFSTRFGLPNGFCKITWHSYTYRAIVTNECSRGLTMLLRGDGLQRSFGVFYKLIHMACACKRLLVKSWSHKCLQA